MIVKSAVCHFAPKSLEGDQLAVRAIACDLHYFNLKKFSKPSGPVDEAGVFLEEDRYLRIKLVSQNNFKLICSDSSS